MAVLLPFADRLANRTRIYDQRFWNNDGTDWGNGNAGSSLPVGGKVTEDVRAGRTHVNTDTTLFEQVSSGGGSGNLGFTLKAKGLYELIFEAVLQANDDAAPAEFDCFGRWEIDGVNEPLQTRFQIAQDLSNRQRVSMKGRLRYRKTGDADITAVPVIQFALDGSGTGRNVTVDRATSIVEILEIWQ